MTLPLGQTLKIRTMVYVAGEPIPFFWPMRSFIHHNPLHGLEHLPFDKAVALGMIKESKAQFGADSIDIETIRDGIEKLG